MKIQKTHKKNIKRLPLTKEDRINNKFISRERIVVENVIAKKFKIISERYRNRRKRFILRFILIAAIYNFELK